MPNSLARFMSSAWRRLVVAGGAQRPVKGFWLVLVRQVAFAVGRGGSVIVVCHNCTVTADLDTRSTPRLLPRHLTPEPKSLLRRNYTRHSAPSLPQPLPGTSSNRDLDILSVVLLFLFLSTKELSFKAV